MGIVKHHIASLFTDKRNAESLLVDTIMAFYGDPHHAHEGVTPELCKDLIHHVHKWCDDFIDKNMYPGGDLESLATYLCMNPSEEATSDQIEDKGLFQDDNQRETPPVKISTICGSRLAHTVGTVKIAPHVTPHIEMKTTRLVNGAPIIMSVPQATKSKLQFVFMGDECYMLNPALSQRLSSHEERC